jgi:hypothetical protein
MTAVKWTRTVESFANLARVRFVHNGSPINGRVVKWGIRGDSEYVYLILLDDTNDKVIAPVNTCRIILGNVDERPAARSPSAVLSAPSSTHQASKTAVADPAASSASSARAARAASRTTTALAPFPIAVTPSNPKAFDPSVTGAAALFNSVRF